MTIFNAVSIEHTLARFFGGEHGERGTFYDADMFRSGDPDNLAVIIGNVADMLETRILFIRFPEDGRGSAKSQVRWSVSQLRTMAEQIRQRTECEHEDYHWEVFDALMSAIVGLLETLEALTPLQ